MPLAAAEAGRVESRDPLIEVCDPLVFQWNSFCFINDFSEIERQNRCATA